MTETHPLKNVVFFPNKQKSILFKCCFFIFDKPQQGYYINGLVKPKVTSLELDVWFFQYYMEAPTILLGNL